jgi:hypothetical protein
MYVIVTATETVETYDRTEMLKLINRLDGKRQAFTLTVRGGIQK